mmetsp:Transcript_25013/g.63703  ORF Transcript_25013/g.63703 Transcript_25013/m.63703 type:complete len:352 (-) Transcript_25013:92-1147(-)
MMRESTSASECVVPAYSHHPGASEPHGQLPQSQPLPRSFATASSTRRSGAALGVALWLCRRHHRHADLTAGDDERERIGGARNILHRLLRRFRHGAVDREDDVADLELAGARRRALRRLDCRDVDPHTARRVRESEGAVVARGVRVCDRDEARGRVAGDLEDDLTLDVGQLLDDHVRIYDALLADGQDDVSHEEAGAVRGKARLELEHDHAILALAAIRQGHAKAIITYRRPHEVRPELARHAGGRDANVALDLLGINREGVGEPRRTSLLDRDGRWAAADGEVVLRAAVDEVAGELLRPLDHVVVDVDLTDPRAPTVPQDDLEELAVERVHPFDVDHVKVLELLGLHDAH